MHWESSICLRELKMKIFLYLIWTLNIADQLTCLLLIFLYLLIVSDPQFLFKMGLQMKMILLLKYLRFFNSIQTLNYLFSKAALLKNLWKSGFWWHTMWLSISTVIHQVSPLTCLETNLSGLSVPAWKESRAVSVSISPPSELTLQAELWYRPIPTVLSMKLLFLSMLPKTSRIQKGLTSTI